MMALISYPNRYYNCPQHLTKPYTTYILTGFLPIKAEIQAFALYGNICRSQDSIEKKLALGQLSLSTRLLQKVTGSPRSEYPSRNITLVQPIIW